jgi:Mrp family chromosome partitioning ATPase
MSGDPPRDQGEHRVAARGAAGPLIRAVAAYRWVVLLVAVATLAGGVAYVAHRTPKYQADVQVLFTPLSSGDGAQGLPLVVASADPTRDAQTAVTLLGGPNAAALAARQLGGGWSAHQVTQATTIVQTGESNIIAVEGHAQSATLATRLATAFAQASLDVRRAQLRRAALLVSPTVPARPGPNDVEGQARRSENNLVLAGADPNFSIQGPVSSASSTATPAAAILPLAALGGIALGILAAILFDVFSNRVRDADELRELYPVPVLGYLPRLPRRERAVSHERIVSKTLMAPAQLLANRLLARARGGQVLLATGASVGDGTTTTLIQLAAALLASGRQVLVIDCDLRTADATARLGLHGHHPGLAEVVTGEAALSECVTWAPAVPELQLLPAGRPKGSTPSARWPSTRLARGVGRAIEDARKLADYVLLDTPPLGQQPDLVSVVACVDAILVMARPGHTRRAEFTLLRDLLDASRSTAVNLVVVGEHSGLSQPRATAAGSLDTRRRARPVPAARVAAAGRRPPQRPRPARTDGKTPAEKRRSEA